VSERIHKNERILGKLCQQLNTDLEGGNIGAALPVFPKIVWKGTVLIKLYGVETFEALRGSVDNGADYYRGCVLLAVPLAESSKICDLLSKRRDLLEFVEILDPLTDRDAILAQLQEEPLAQAIQYGQDTVAVAVAKSVEEDRNAR